MIMGNKTSNLKSPTHQEKHQIRAISDAFRVDGNGRYAKKKRKPPPPPSIPSIGESRLPDTSTARVRKQMSNHGRDLLNAGFVTTTNGGTTPAAVADPFIPEATVLNGVHGSDAHGNVTHASVTASFADNMNTVEAINGSAYAPGTLGDMAQRPGVYTFDQRMKATQALTRGAALTDPIPM